MKTLQELDDPFFYIGNKLPKDFFPADYEYYLSHSSQQPWKEGEKALKQIVKRWEGKRRGLDDLFQQRDTNEIQKVMVESIALFLQYLFWSNEQPVNLFQLNDRVSQLKVKPMNVKDRLQFIMKRPVLHHSYVQLQELFVEQEKAYYKHVTIRKRL